MNMADSARLTPEQRGPLEGLLPLEYPDRLKDMALTVYARLLEELPPRESAEMHRLAWLSFSIVESLSVEHGGANFYMMSAKQYRLTQRDREMMGRFNGKNIPELAREYRLSEPHVRRIVAVWYREYQQRSQGHLAL